jgi:hypothetical protein
MGNCSEQHRQEWAALWFARSGVDESRLEHGQEGSVSWWGGTMDSGTDVSVQGGSSSLELDLKLLVACHLRGRHLVNFIKSQPGGLRGIMEADVGQNRLGVPSDNFFQFLRVVLAHAGQYLGAVCHVEGAGCGCGCGITGNHRNTQVDLEGDVSGEKGVVHHGLHWYGFTGVFNDDGFSEDHPPSLAFRFYRLVRDCKSEVEPVADEFTFCLPYPLDPLLVLRGASSGRVSNRFSLSKDLTDREEGMTSDDEILQLRDRAGWERSDKDCSFAALCGEVQLFKALSVLEKSAKHGRHHVCFFLAFWMLQHLRGLFHQPAGSPNFFFRKFKVDVYIHLAKAMAVFFLPFDLAISCLTLADGSAALPGGDVHASNMFANQWQMAAARHAVLVAYGLYSEAAAVFVRMLGRIPVCSLYYDELVIDHMLSQLNHALDILLEMYVSVLMHKFCDPDRNCWDPDSNSSTKLERILGQLKRTLYGRLAEENVSKSLRVNLRSTLNLLPLFEEAGKKIKFPATHRSLSTEQERDRDAQRNRAFINAHSALRFNAPLRPESRLLAARLSSTFAEVVPMYGSQMSHRPNYVTFMQNMTEDKGVCSTSGETWWSQGRPLADRLYAGLVFYLLWHGPTKKEPFWPEWDPTLAGPPSLESHLAAQETRDYVSRLRHATIREQWRVGQLVRKLYMNNTDSRHPRIPLISLFLYYFSKEKFIPPLGAEHTNTTASCVAIAAAQSVSLHQSSSELFAGTDDAGGSGSSGSFLSHVLNRDSLLTQDVLDFGRRAVRWTEEF